jgi:hypothetical protein
MLQSALGNRSDRLLMAMGRKRYLQCRNTYGFGRLGRSGYIFTRWIHGWDGRMNMSIEPGLRAFGHGFGCYFTALAVVARLDVKTPEIYIARTLCYDLPSDVALRRMRFV